jgi:hypothetical protein
MEISLLALIGIGLAAMFFGYFFGLFEGRGQGYKRRSKEEEQFQELKTIAGQAKTDYANAPNLLELARREGGEPLVRIDGRPVDRLHMAADERKRLIECMILLRPWVEPPEQGSSTRTATRLPGDSAAPPAGRGAGARGATARKPTSPEPEAGGSAPPSASAPPPPTSLVQQIDAILQEQIAGTSLADRGIRLAEALHGGAMVFIGQTSYDGVDNVPDPEIQVAIRAAIAEWEKTAS